VAKVTPMVKVTLVYGTVNIMLVRLITICQVSL